jgi:hypothetical protein
MVHDLQRLSHFIWRAEGLQHPAFGQNEKGSYSFRVISDDITLGSFNAGLNRRVCNGWNVGGGRYDWRNPTEVQAFRSDLRWPKY